MLKSLRTTRGRIVIAFVSSITLAALWVAFEMPNAILPALVIPFWIPIFARQQEEPVSSGTRRIMLTFVVLGMFMLLGLATVYFVQS